MGETTVDGNRAKGGMVMDGLQQNAHDLEKELAWFAQLLDARALSYILGKKRP